MPKVFISHASEDKERFVTRFAAKLRQSGIDAWVDQWEIKPGDSLVQKIFTEGLDKSELVIAVLSKTSITKRWVREELDASVVNKIQKDSKIIPIVLDNLSEQEIPQSLRSILHVKINDIESYESEFNRIVNVIHGYDDKPALGSPPAYLTSNISSLPGLTRVDTLVLKTLYSNLVNEKNLMTIMMINSDDIEELGIPPSVLAESLDVLDSLSLIKPVKFIGMPVSQFMPTTYGFEVYGGHFVDNFEAITNKIVIYIVNNNPCDSRTISNDTEESEIFVNYVLRLLDQQGLAKVAFSSGYDYVQRVDARLIRKMRDA